MQEWLLDQWQRHKKTILFITHDVEEAVFLSSSVLVVDKTPIHTLREIPVPMDYPRTGQDLTRPEIVALRGTAGGHAEKAGDGMKKKPAGGNLPALIFLFALLILWQLGAWR